MIKHELNAIANAFAFFSRIPVPQWVTFGADAQQHASRYFPLVGWVLAGLLALLWYVGSFLWPTLVVVILVMAAGVWLTGGFHEDGFADCCDGFGGGYHKDQILTIMKDSRLGTYGVLGSILLILLKLALLSQLSWTALLISYPFSRVMPVWMMALMTYARVDGSGKAGGVSRGINGLDVGIATVTGLLSYLLLPSFDVAFVSCMIGVPVGITYLFSRYLQRQIGGFTGDCLGAAQQLAEVSIYLVLGAQWHSFG
ncbi:adenosylcobinamide-GDP ribazoletransferase [Celerinatantimonas sp. YJH-8]|uniref:adenosylcobinamide-GDP ribazoletransferase n=1 Tax=Celerinatantimonas sp. YJH-8 TaxID=3228714 RepID=UPI0038CB0404